MNKRIFLSVLLPFCFFEIAKCSDVILVNLCGQEVKVVYNSLKSKAMDGEALTLRNVAVKNSETIFIAPVSRFRFHEKERYATMALNAENDHIIFGINDEGYGMSQEDQMRVFEPFYQVDSALRRRHGGTGLGLAICRGLVGAHGGTVDITDGHGGQGTCMVIRLPLRVPSMDTAHE